MDFLKISGTLLREFDENDVRYAVIGGFALGFWGVARTTMDMDFLLLLDDTEKADAILKRNHFDRIFHSENVARYQGQPASLGSIDIIYAFREVSRNMLARSVEIPVSDDLKVVSLVPEDIIGLKIQAIANDPARRNRDMFDIRALLAARIHRKETIDWQSLEGYFSLFDFADLFHELKRDYGAQ